MPESERYGYNNGNVAAQIVQTRNIIDSKYEDNLQPNPKQIFRKKFYTYESGYPAYRDVNEEMEILEESMNETKRTFNGYKINEKGKLSFIKILDFLNQKLILLQQIELLFIKSVCIKYGLDFGKQKAEYEKYIAEDNGNPNRMDVFFATLKQKKITLDKYHDDQLKFKIMSNFDYVKNFANVFNVLQSVAYEKMHGKQDSLEKEAKKLSSEVKELSSEVGELLSNNILAEVGDKKKKIKEIEKEIKEIEKEIKEIKGEIIFLQIVKSRHLRPLDEKISAQHSNFAPMARLPLNLDLDTKLSMDDKNFEEILLESSGRIEDMARNKEDGVGEAEIYIMEAITQKLSRSNSQTKIEDENVETKSKPITVKNPIVVSRLSGRLSNVFSRNF